jgi:hypothetical protein
VRVVMVLRSFAHVGVPSQMTSPMRQGLGTVTCFGSDDSTLLRLPMIRSTHPAIGGMPPKVSICPQQTPFD